MSKKGTRAQLSCSGNLGTSALSNLNQYSTNVLIISLTLSLTSSSSKHSYLAEFVSKARKAKQCLSDIGLPEAANNPVYINDHLTPENKALFSQALASKKGNNRKFLWTDNCQIKARKTTESKVLRITCEADLPENLLFALPSCGYAGFLSTASVKEYDSFVSVKDGLHSCRQCNYVTNIKTNMVVHVRRHTGERPFKCHLCPAAFVQADKLAQHIRTHTGDRPFSCVRCIASFSQRCHLVRHMSTHLNKKRI
nr:zinc finger protein 35-like [Rhipicephalus microplus]